MTSRRQVLGAGLALTVMPALGDCTTRRASPEPLSRPVGHLLVDARFSDAVAMAAHAATAPDAVTTIGRDALGLWHELLLPAVQDGIIIGFAGVTTPHGLFLMQTLAADHRMRVVYRAEHRPAEQGVVRHGLSGPASLLSRVARPSAVGDWRLQFGGALRACPAAGRALTRTVLTQDVGASDRDETLASWIIMPRQPVASQLSTPGHWF
jgi:hypothetical protein